jgi:8-oxo-dGTP pyrophosphatase MutT (NUDIX family)
MVKIKNILLCLVASCISDLSVHAVPRSLAYKFESASVLPLCVHHGKKYVILGRETKGRYAGSYDNFGGGREAGEDNHVLTAAREFFEEAILLLTVGFTLKDVEHYLDITKTNNTEIIIAYNESFTYIIDFNNYKKKILKNFHKALQETTDPHSLEKDRIALILWEDLERAIQTNRMSISALELDPITLQLVATTIQLRPYLMRQLKPFFMNQAYRQEMNHKMRFYDQYE